MIKSDLLDKPSDLSTQKQLARKAASRQRKEVASLDDGDAPQKIYAHIKSLNLISEGMVVSGFLPIGSEIDTRPILESLRQDGCIICLPCVIADATPLVFRKWAPDDMLVKEKFGTMAPAESAEIVVPDVILSPMLAFDRAGYRLGYGGGFYDRSLAQIRKNKPVIAIGVAYAGQETKSVPHDDLDQPLDFVLTEKEVIKP